MANHEVLMTIPERSLGRADAKFKVKANGQVIGTLTVSNGSLVWFPRYTSYGLKIGWKRFDALMKEHATRIEKR